MPSLVYRLHFYKCLKVRNQQFLYSCFRPARDFRVSGPYGRLCWRADIQFQLKFSGKSGMLPHPIAVSSLQYGQKVHHQERTP